MFSRMCFLVLDLTITSLIYVSVSRLSAMSILLLVRRSFNWTFKNEKVMECYLYSGQNSVVYLVKLWIWLLDGVVMWCVTDPFGFSLLTVHFDEIHHAYLFFFLITHVVSFPHPPQKVTFNKKVLLEIGHF